ncbi:glycosyltransferase family 39 protein [Halovivax gelatinilyticus]|uniref:glycosyltransferase family 39 protein n=1 Tax=Halovivax gelatinilyticus TaxID=2961597 RepID=UPI0020CA841D|nr:glycosyltransferase family 39 protein [Halovivax gelatinilyticus]
MNRAVGRAPVVWAGKVLAVAFTVAYAVDAVGLVGVWGNLGRETLFAFAISSAYALVSIALLSAFGSASPVRSRDVDAETWFLTDRLSGAFVRFVSVTTLLAVVLVGSLIAAARLGVGPDSIDIGPLAYLTVGLVVLTLVVRDDEATGAVARGAAVLAVAIVVLSTFSSTILEVLPVEGSVLAAVLVGVVLWNRPTEREVTGEKATRWTVRVFDGRTYRFLLALVTAIGATAFTFRLGALHLQGDEYLVADTAASYYFSGELYRWNWIADEHAGRYYDRAWPHTLLVAGSYAIFGVSEWSARIVSAAVGVLAIPITYVVVAYFTERRLVALVSCLAMAVYPGFVFYFRWARMYALLIPLFLLLTYFVYRSVTESNPIGFGHDRLDETIDRYADFNYAIGLVTIPVLYVAYQIHYNALVVIAATYVYVVYRAIATGERKYYTASAVGLVGIAAVAVVAHQTDSLGFLDQFLSFFDRENTVYHSYLFRYPFEWTFGLVLAVAGLAIPARLENRDLTHKLVFVYILCGFALVFYVYVGDRYASFAYVVHVVPFAIALVVFAYVSFVDALRTPVLRYALVALLVVSLAAPMIGVGDGNDYRSLYYEDSEDFDTAYGTIVEEFDEGDVLIAQYARDFYLRDLPEDTEWISMRNNQDYGPDEFHDDVERHGSGWITWESGKAYHVHPEVRAYIDEHFEQHHGVAVDDTRVEVWYFDEEMID